MTYTLSYDQVRAIAWKLTVSEALVMNWLCGAKLWASEVSFEDETYYFASKTKCLYDLPHVTNKPDTVYRIYKKLVEKRLIKLIKIGVRDYVAITPLGATWGQPLHENSEVLLLAMKETQEKIDAMDSDNNSKNGLSSETKTDVNPTYYNIKETDSKTRNYLLANPSDSPRNFSTSSTKSLEPTSKIVESEDRITKKFTRFDTYENIFLTKEGTLNYLRSRLSIYSEYSIIDVGRLILEALRYYQTNDLHDSRKNTEAFVDSWLRTNLDRGNAVPQYSPDSYNEIDTSMLSTFVENTTERLYRVFTPEVAETPKRKGRNLLADDLDD